MPNALRKRSPGWRIRARRENGGHRPGAQSLDALAGKNPEAGAQIVMRVTSDCPLIDPALCGEVLRRRSETGADYACNNMPPSFPHGLDCEAFTVEALRRADAEARGADDREHVTPWLRRASGIARASIKGPGGG